MLNTQDQILIEQRISNEKPSVAVAYLLCLFLGVFGAHRFYLGKKGSGVAMLLCSITLFGLAISGPWAIVDLFLIPGIIREQVDGMRQKMTVGAMASPSAALSAG